MEISECYLLPKICRHSRMCQYGICHRIGAQQCVHAVIYEGKLQVMKGAQLFTLIDRNHSEFDHLYKLYDEQYLEELRNKKLEHDKQVLEHYEKTQKQEELRQLEFDKVQKQRKLDTFYQYTAELKIRSN